MNEDTARDAESILHKHADAHIVLAQEMALFALTLKREGEAIGARLQTLEVKLNTMHADLEHRIVVLESRMENVLARLDGHDLGFATMAVDEEGKKSLARMQRLRESDRSIVPEKKGTSES